MSFLDKLSALIPFGKKAETAEYFFALNITSENLTAALWTIEGKQLKILEIAADNYSSLDDLTSLTDKLLDAVLGIREIDVQKILFGVPNSWLSDENLKDEYLKILRGLVKELELTPMAYVENSHALVHFLEKQEGIPPTAILVGFNTHHLTIAVVRAGKPDGVKIISRTENSGVDIEKALLTFTSVETLPSKVLIYGDSAENLEKLKSQLLSFSWMSKLSFLHFPKMEILQDEIEIKSICLAGASEIDSSITYTENIPNKVTKKTKIISAEDGQKEETEDEQLKADQKEDLGFMVGDIAAIEANNEKGLSEDEISQKVELPGENELVLPEETSLSEIEDFEHDLPVSESIPEQQKQKVSLNRFLPKGVKNLSLLLGTIGILIILLGAYLFLPKADVKIFVEPKILEKDTQVIADPSQKTVNEDSKVIPGQIIETELSGSSKAPASGKKQIGDPARGTVVIYNKTFESKTISKGITLSGSNGLKFTLDVSVNIASQSSTDSGITYGKANATVTASTVGADGNLPSGSELTVNNFSSSQVSAKAEGNFSGGTSKEVTVVSDEDQKRLLASLTSDLRKQAQQKLQEKMPQKKILEEALAEEITKKSFNKNINDQASEFSLNLTARYKGTAFEDKDLKLIVSKLVTTDVPEGFELNLEDTETQADVSNLQKDGKLVFLARFKAKLLPKIDIEKIKNQIKGKSFNEAVNIIKAIDNVLGSEIKISPALPSFLQRIPILSKNIKIEVGLK